MSGVAEVGVTGVRLPPAQSSGGGVPGTSTRTATSRADLGAVLRSAELWRHPGPSAVLRDTWHDLRAGGGRVAMSAGVQVVGTACAPASGGPADAVQDGCALEVPGRRGQGDE